MIAALALRPASNPEVSGERSRLCVAVYRSDTGPLPFSMCTRNEKFIEKSFADRLTINLPGLWVSF